MFFKKYTEIISLIVVFLSIIIGLYLYVFHFKPPTPINSASLPPAGFQLELVSNSWCKKYDFAIMEGQVKNTSNIPLRSVAAIASFYDENGVVVASSEALIDCNPILPGQTSPFKVITIWDPAMKKAGVEFKFLMGGTIFTRHPSEK